MRILLSLLLSTTLALAMCQSNRSSGYPPTLEGASVETYKQIGDLKLDLWIYYPQNHEAGAGKPAIVFFFGGGWRRGNPAQFQKHCEYLAARGMVAITADYRVSTRHGVKAKACVADAKSAIRWVRQHAERLGVDPGKIVAGGGSAGGHLAASTASLSGFDESTENQNISSRPNALALFNPALVLDNIPDFWEIPGEKLLELADRMGTDPSELSPYHHIHSEIGPTIIFHGTGDQTVPFKTAELFHESLKATGVRSELIGYKGQAHGFFNFGRDGNGAFIDTVNKLDAFLVSIGYLPAPPAVVSK